MDRPLTKQGRSWLWQGLEQTRPHLENGRWGKDGRTGERWPDGSPRNPADWAECIAGLRVVGQCHCGEPDCHTVRFRSVDAERVAVFSGQTEDGRLLIFCANCKTGMLTEREIIQLRPDRKGRPRPFRHSSRPGRQATVLRPCGGQR